MNQSTHDFINQFFNLLLGFSPTINITETQDQMFVQLELDPPHSGVLIGYQGETLNAIQLLFSLVYQNHHQSWKPIRLNINDYRQKRQQSVETLANNIAAKVVAENQSISLTNLSSYERRIIHSHLSNDPSVSTHSEGEPPHRILIVSPSSH